MEDFLEEQEQRLKPRTYRGYEESIFLFEDCLNGYAYQSLDKEESKMYDKLRNEGKQFCEIFGANKILSEIRHFLDYFMIRKVMASKEFMKTVGRVMKKFVTWLHNKSYINEEDFKYYRKEIKDIKDELPAVEELSDLIYEYIQNNYPVGITETLEGYFEVSKIEPGKLWVDDYMGSEENIGPVIVSDKISSKCKNGWVICLVLGKTKKDWQMLNSGNVYPD